MRVTQTLPQDAAMLVCVLMFGLLRAVIPRLEFSDFSQFLKWGFYYPLMRGKKSENKKQPS